MLKLHRAFALIFTFALVLSACVAPVAPATEVSTPATEVTPTEAPIAESAAETRVITHVMGEITLPATPQRLVVLEWSYLEDVLALGVQPVGVADIEGYHSWVKIPVELAPDVVDVGTRQAPGLESIAALQPDLIIAAASRVAENYDELSAIAPTLVFDNYPTNITHYESTIQTLNTIADILGRQSEAEAVLAEVEAKFAEARTQLEAAGKIGEKFALAQAYTSENVAQVRLFTDNALAVQVIAQLGLENGWTEAAQPYGFSTVSVEALPELGDLNFFYVVQDDDNVFTTDAVSPLWENLEFVKNNHAYPLGGDTWLFGGPYSINLLVDIVMNALLAETAHSPDAAPVRS
jgi:iron complex transport system substrate-binding protein